MYQLTGYSTEAFTKPYRRTDRLESLLSFARRMLSETPGCIEIRDASERLVRKLWTEDTAIIEWSNEL